MTSTSAGAKSAEQMTITQLAWMTLFRNPLCFCFILTSKNLPETVAVPAIVQTDMNARVRRQLTALLIYPNLISVRIAISLSNLTGDRALI